MGPADTERTNDLSVLQQWVGRSATTTVAIDEAHTGRVAATLGYEPLGAGQALPALWHWCFGTDTVDTGRLDRDGHGPRGTFLPPVSLPRRMWAGGRVTFHAPLRVGDVVERTAHVASVRAKTGGSGDLIFVTTQHRYRRDDQVLIDEEVDLVYRHPPDLLAPPPEPTRARSDSAWTEMVTPAEALLFRYSAVTFNSHRIHYDYPYATGVEGYPGLVVHGPLTATLLASFAERCSGAALGSFRYRGQAPLIAPDPFTLHGAPAQDDQSGSAIDLWVANGHGALTMSAEATFILPLSTD